ncbi:hypothetical protein [Rhodomicrobium lacus]|uniref:hypothetical protein n=1 Tax=Rhodomicrobium TaxID=1068 RepID=UPI0026E217D4|nr:hypothetical protein [Rhodomicrobium lacus]WKW50287.1 hypothetical protein QMO75_13515 [Rhodomicrobium lacus]
MIDESDIATLNRRLTLLEEDAKGEKAVSRHILRKVTDNENALLEVKAELGDIRKEVSALRSEIVALRSDLPGIVATCVTAIIREELSRGH